MIRAVTDDMPPCAIADGIHVVGQEAVASGAVVFFAAWETPDGTVHLRSVPSSQAVIRGLVDRLHEIIHPEYLDMHE